MLDIRKRSIILQLNLKVKRKISVELFEEYEAVNFYTIRFDGEETEADKFFASIPDDVEFDFDYDVISRWIEKIGEKGALERYFRTEGKFKDGIGSDYSV